METCEGECDEFFSLTAPNEFLPPPETWMDGTLCLGNEEDCARLQVEMQKMELLPCDEKMAEMGSVQEQGGAIEEREMTRVTEGQNRSTPCILGMLLSLNIASVEDQRVSVATIA